MEGDRLWPTDGLQAEVRVHAAGRRPGGRIHRLQHQDGRIRQHQAGATVAKGERILENIYYFCLAILIGKLEHLKNIKFSSIIFLSV